MYAFYFGKTFVNAITVFKLHTLLTFYYYVHRSVQLKNVLNYPNRIFR